MSGRPKSVVLLVALALGIGVVATGSSAAGPGALAAAQPTTETPFHPAALHTGSCRRPSADPVYRLALVGPERGAPGESVSAADRDGRLTTPPLLFGSGVIPVPLADLLAAAPPYVLVVHEREGASARPLACGEVAGVADGDRVAVALRPLAGSGSAGLALLTASATGGTAATVFLFAEVDAFADAAPVAPPAGTPAGDANCADFPFQEDAQAFFEANGGSATSNVAGLDDNANGLACESLPFRGPAGTTATEPAATTAPDGAVPAATPVALRTRS